MNETFRATGYEPNEYFFASCYRQGGRLVYALDFSVRELVTFLPKPDPDKPLDASSTQRRIIAGHARDFGAYVKEDRGWVSPALLLWSPDIFDFEPLPQLETGSTTFGQLGVPKDAKSEIKIVDGQHRTLGFHLAWEQLLDDITKARGTLAKARDLGEPAVVADREKGLARLLERRDDLARERVSIQIVVVDNPDTARRIFVDINDNAKGITGAVRNRFDDRKAVSRALNKVIENNELLRGRVDLEQDRVSGSSQYLLGAKHVADILRALAVGNGRIGKRVEDELEDHQLATEFDHFTDALLDAFPALSDLETGELTPSELRRSSLIGSNVLLRSFAAAWYELRQGGWSQQRIADSFKAFEPYMSVPVYPSNEDSWFVTGVFAPSRDGAYSPTSRMQDFKTLTKFIVTQAQAGTSARWNRASSADRKLLPSS